jgi:hypothetical protein
VTVDCDVSGDRARFGFQQAPMDLEVDVTAEPGKLVRMHVTEGYAEIDLGHTAQTWALIMERLSAYAGTGEPNPFFPAAS